jgi:hypothetical protein
MLITNFGLMERRTTLFTSHILPKLAIRKPTKVATRKSSPKGIAKCKNVNY